MFDIFLHFGAREPSGPSQNRFVHNNLTRRIDPRHPEGPWFDFFSGSRFCVLHFSDFGPRLRAWAPGHRPRAKAGPEPMGTGHRPMGPWPPREVCLNFSPSNFGPWAKDPGYFMASPTEKMIKKNRVGFPPSHCFPNYRVKLRGWLVFTKAFGLWGIVLDVCTDMELIDVLV